MKRKNLSIIRFAVLFILYFTLLDGCTPKFRHFFNQETTIDLHIDGLLMLKLLQQKSSKFNTVNINIITDLKANPFKRLLNRNNYSKDLEIIPKEWNKIEEYNNSYYLLNEKYQEYLEDPWDDILLKGLYSDIIGFNSADFDRLLSLQTGKGDYTDTHVFLSLLFLKKNNGFDQNKIDMALKTLTINLIKAQDNEKTFSDLYVERIVFLYWAGFGNLVKKEWINIIENAKNKDLGWTAYEEEKDSNPHSTGLALLSIIYFNEGKNKQFFY